MSRAQTVILPANASRESAMNRLLEAVMALPLNKPWRIRWAVYRKDRSEEQNNALWGVAYKYLRKETGNEKAGLHDYFCREYFGEVERTVLGRTRTYPRRTTTKDEHGEDDVLSTKDFMDFYAFIQQHMAEKFGLDVPDPDPQWRDHQVAA